MNLNDFITKYLFIEPEVDGATLYEPVESLACAWMAVSNSPVQPLRFALHLRSLIPTIRVEEVAPDEIVVFGVSHSRRTPAKADMKNFWSH